MINLQRLPYSHLVFGGRLCEAGGGDLAGGRSGGHSRKRECVCFVSISIAVVVILERTCVGYF